MTDTLTTIISKCQASLLDTGTLFTTATITAACRQALKDFNLRAPVFHGELVDAVSEQKDYVLDTIIFENLINVIDVLLWDDGGDDYEPLLFDHYFEDAAPIIRLRTPRTDGEFLVVRYTMPYTVNGLDSAVESTLPAFYDPILLDGVCYWTLQIRGVSRIESINLSQGQPQNYDNLQNVYKEAFDAGLNRAAQQKQPVSEPATHPGWNDRYYNWNA
jgi:hypothetical protein